MTFRQWYLSKRGGIEETATFLFIMVACIPVLLVGWRSLSLIADNHSRDVTNIESESASRLASDVEGFVNDALGLITINAEALKGVKVSEGRDTWQKRVAEGILAENQSIKAIRFVAPDGTESYATAREYTVDEQLNLSALPGFTAARRGVSYVGPPHITEQGLRLTIAAPVIVDSQVIQIVMAELDLKPITRFVERTNIGHTGYALLLDGTGSVIAGGRNVQPGEYLKGWDKVTSLLSKVDAYAPPTSGRYVSPLSGLPVAGYSTVTSSLKWVVLVEWPLEDADALLSQVRTEVILGVLVAIILIFIIIPVFAIRLVRPIKTLEGAARKVESGDLSGTVEIKTGNELEDLGRAFNKMTAGLRTLEELRNEFVYVITHELRAPLTAIRGYVSFLKDGTAGPLSADAVTYVDTIWKSTERLGGLISDLLDAAKLESGQFTLELAPCDPKPLISETVQEFSILANERKIHIIPELHDETIRVSADPQRLKQVLANLVSNAIKYNKEEGTIWITSTSGGETLSITVKNNGPAIPTESQPSIFQKYFRSKDSNKIVGTGLGLYITKQLVEKMGGTITFSSSEKEGTEFTFTLKRAS